jgi:hypothetical protein
MRGKPFLKKGVFPAPLSQKPLAKGEKGMVANIRREYDIQQRRREKGNIA